MNMVETNEICIIRIRYLQKTTAFTNNETQLNTN